MKNVVFRNACLVVMAAIMSGCGGGTEPLHRVSGTVTYEGKPVPNVNVIFTPKGGSGRPGTAVTDANGKFASATTYEPGDGVIPGSHTVTLAVIGNTTGDSTDVGESAYDTEASTAALPFPAKYLNTVESGLTVDVNSSGQNLDIALKD